MAESGCFQDPPISAGNRPDKNRLVLRGKKEMCQSILSIHPETQMPSASKLAGTNRVTCIPRSFTSLGPSVFAEGLLAFPEEEVER